MIISERDIFSCFVTYITNTLAKSSSTWYWSMYQYIVQMITHSSSKTTYLRVWQSPASLLYYPNFYHHWLWCIGVGIGSLTFVANYEVILSEFIRTQIGAIEIRRVNDSKWAVENNISLNDSLWSPVNTLLHCCYCCSRMSNWMISSG